jgi:hypothetical protein
VRFRDCDVRKVHSSPRFNRRGCGTIKKGTQISLLFAGALTLSATARAQEACPPPHDDYRRPIPVWGGFGFQVNACPGDKIEVAAALVVASSGTHGVLKIPQTLPWNVDLSGLAPDQVESLRADCQSDLPCVAHFKVTVLRIERPALTVRPGEWRDGEMVCSKDSFGTTGCRGPGAGRVIATIDGWR